MWIPNYIGKLNVLAGDSADQKEKKNGLFNKCVEAIGYPYRK